jgi:hypothetical protein
LTPAHLVQPVPLKLSGHAHVDEHRAFGTEKLLAQGEQDVIPGAEGISTRHGRRAALMIGGSSQFMGAARLGVYGLPRALVGWRIGSNMASNMP